MKESVRIALSEISEQLRQFLEIVDTSNVLWFDEMNLLPEEKTIRVNHTKYFEDVMYGFFTEKKDSLSDMLIDYYAFWDGFQSDLVDIYTEFEKQFNFGGAEATTRAKQFSLYVTQTTKDNPERDYNYSFERARMIARNETNNLANLLRHEQAVKDGYTTHSWLCMMDGKERETHHEADKQEIPIDTPFTIGGYLMMFPLDQSYGAPAKEILNCRCIEVFSK